MFKRPDPSQIFTRWLQNCRFSLMTAQKAMPDGIILHSGDNAAPRELVVRPWGDPGGVSLGRRLG